MRKVAAIGSAPTAVTLPREYAPTMPPSTKWSNMPGCPAGERVAGHHGSTDRMAAMAVYIGDDSQELPLGSMGLSEAPTVDGIPVDLRRVFWEVQDRGGFEQVSSLDTWQPVAEAATGLKNLNKRAARSVMTMYRMFLFELDDSGRRLGGNRKKSRGTSRGRNCHEVERDRIDAGTRVVRARPLTNWDELFAQCSPAPYLHLIDTEEKFWQCVKEFENLPEYNAFAVQTIPKSYAVSFPSEDVPVYKMFLDTTRVGGFKVLKAKHGLRAKMARERFNLHFQNSGGFLFGETSGTGWKEKVRKGLAVAVSVWDRLQLAMLESFLLQKASNRVQNPLPVVDPVRPSCQPSPQEEVPTVHQIGSQHTDGALTRKLETEEIRRGFVAEEEELMRPFT